MKSIYASKLYITSSRKDRIHAALLSPANIELKAQLVENLDDKYVEKIKEQKEENSKDKSTEIEPNSFDDFFKDSEEINPKTDLMTIDDMKHSSTPSSHSSDVVPDYKENNENDGDDRDDRDANRSELIPDSPATDTNNEEKDTSASTKIACSILSDLNVLKGTLNNNAQTAGVIRIAEKGQELWIYYKDSVNLNDIMAEVVDYFESTYSGVEFNRLARTDNAMVFIRTIETANDMVIAASKVTKVDPIIKVSDKQAHNTAEGDNKKKLGSQGFQEMLDNETAKLDEQDS